MLLLRINNHLKHFLDMTRARIRYGGEAFFFPFNYAGAIAI
jgi:hypothetical protein